MREDPTITAERIADLRADPDITIRTEVHKDGTYKGVSKWLGKGIGWSSPKWYKFIEKEGEDE